MFEQRYGKQSRRASCDRRSLNKAWNESNLHNGQFFTYPMHWQSMVLVFALPRLTPENEYHASAWGIWFGSKLSTANGLIKLGGGIGAPTGAGIVSGFNACGAIGRFAAGFACDRYGSTNMLLLIMALKAVSMLAIWPVSETIGPLVIFAALNGIANGAFFVAMPTAIGRMVGSGQAALGMGMAITGWTGDYLMGSPIAGYLIAATGADRSHSAEPYNRGPPPKHSYLG